MDACRDCLVWLDESQPDAEAFKEDLRGFYFHFDVAERSLISKLQFTDALRQSEEWFKEREQHRQRAICAARAGVFAETQGIFIVERKQTQQGRVTLR
jgi:hypothetical protein